MMKINETKHARRELLDSAKLHIEAGDMDKYNEVMEQVADLNVQIEGMLQFDAEAGKFDDGDQEMERRAIAASIQREEEAEDRTIDDIRGSNEYMNAFMAALRDNVTPTKAVGEKYAPLQAVLTETGSDGADGGFLVPIDIDNRVRDLRRQYIALADLVQVETVSTLSGWRVKDVAGAGGGFAALEAPAGGEGTALKQDSQPKFAKVPYTLTTYGLIIPMSRELAEDEAGNLMGYLSRWIAKKQIITENSLILAKLAALDADAIADKSEIAGLKKALNVTLDPAHSDRATIVTNQGGFNKLDKLVEATGGRPLLQPMPADKTKFSLFGRPVVRMSNANLANVTTTSPVYIGDFEQYMTLFKHRATEIATTDVGGSAWSNYLREVRVITRLAAVEFDAAAVASATIVTA